MEKTKSCKKKEKARLHELLNKLRQLENSLAKTKASNPEVEERNFDLASRVKNAAIALRNRFSIETQKREMEYHEHPERIAFGKLLAKELSFCFKDLELRELDERTKLVAEFGEKFRGQLPQGLAEKLKKLTSSPGNVIVALADIQTENEKLAQKYFALQAKEAAIKNNLESTKIAFANIFSATELADFERQVLKNPDNAAKTDVRKKVKGFGVKYFEELSKQNKQLDHHTKKMENDLKKFREMTVHFVNMKEKKNIEINNKVMEECEILAAKYLREHYF